MFLSFQEDADPPQACGSADSHAPEQICRPLRLPVQGFAERGVRESSAAARSRNRNGKRRPLPAFDDEPRTGPSIQVSDFYCHHGNGRRTTRCRALRRASRYVFYRLARRQANQL